jgi:hypothetical protein
LDFHSIEKINNRYQTKKYLIGIKIKLN